jgi:uncharacterized membrane protein
MTKSVRGSRNGKIILSILAIAGIAIMGYLLSLHFSVEEGAFCNLGEGLSCDIVNKSEYAKIAGIPISLLGLLYFMGVLVAVLWRYERTTLKAIAFFSVMFLGPSLYLSYIEFFVIQNICIFCEISKVLMVAIIGISIWALRPDTLSRSLAITAVIFAGVLAFITYTMQTGAIPSGKYDTFAQCIYEKGFRMYGSATCVFCARQRALFGDSVEYIKEIECDPRNADNESERCITKNVERTPTWIIEDTEGNDIKRFEPGVLSLETLSVESGCVLPQ